MPPCPFILPYPTDSMAPVVLQDELETAMRLCGVTDLEAARGDMSYLNTSELEQYLPKPERRPWFAGLRARL